MYKQRANFCKRESYKELRGHDPRQDGFRDCPYGVGAPQEFDVPAEINALLEARQAARKAKDFKTSDAIRDELKAKGWVIEDTPKGARAKRI